MGRRLGFVQGTWHSDGLCTNPVASNIFKTDTHKKQENILYTGITVELPDVL